MRVSKQPWKLEEEFYVCICGTTAICLTHYPNDPEDTDINIALWEQGVNNRDTSWRERLRYIWYIIRKGHPYTDYVILSQADAIRLAQKLNEWTNKTTGTSG